MIRIGKYIYRKVVLISNDIIQYVSPSTNNSPKLLFANTV